MTALWPTGKTTQPAIVRGYGDMENPFTHVYSHHAGVDIAASGGLFEGTPIYAAEDGTVIYSGLSGTLHSGYGHLNVFHTPQHHFYLYAHMQVGYHAPLGPIKRGDLIGHCGSTGGATGPHCHFGTGIDGWDYEHLTDPVTFMAERNTELASLPTQKITIEENMKPVLVVCTDGPHTGEFAIVSNRGVTPLPAGREETLTGANKILAKLYEGTAPEAVRLTGAEWLLALPVFA